MDFPSAKHKTWLAVLACTSMAVLAVSAQESIIFSRPADKVSERANSFMDQTAHNAPGAIKAPTSIFSPGPATSYDILPGSHPPAPISPEQAKQWQKLLDDRKNWTLMTPQEILGVPTADKILGVPDPSGDDQLSPEERYLKRQERQRSISATNAMFQAFGGQDASADNPFAAAQSERRKSQMDQEFNQRAYLGLPMNNAQNPQPDMESARRLDSPWKSAFITVPAPPKPDPEQVAAMDRFRALLEPAPPEKPATMVSGYMPVVAPKVNPNMEPLPQYNPAGNSFAPLKSSAIRPTGITPLPTITGQTVKSATPKPKPLVKPPPWLSTQPPPLTPFQRNY